MENYIMIDGVKIPLTDEQVKMMRTGASKSNPFEEIREDEVDEYLFDIWAIGCDYDGCGTTEDFKKLVDELVKMANKARGCLWDGKLFGAHGSPEEERE